MIEVFFNTRRDILYVQVAMQCSIYYINTNEIPNPFTFCCKRRDLLCNRSNGDLFTREDNMLFSHVKISCFHAKAHLEFRWCFYNTMKYVFLSSPTDFLTCRCSDDAPVIVFVSKMFAVEDSALPKHRKR